MACLFWYLQRDEKGHGLVCSVSLQLLTLSALTAPQFSPGGPLLPLAAPGWGGKTPPPASGIRMPLTWANQSIAPPGHRKPTAVLSAVLKCSCSVQESEHLRWEENAPDSSQNVPLGRCLFSEQRTFSWKRQPTARLSAESAKAGTVHACIPGPGVDSSR